MRKLTYMILNVAVILTVSILGGCHPGPSMPDKIDNKAIVNLPYEKAWLIAHQILASEGYPIQNSFKEFGTIASGTKTVKLQTTDADCGSYMGFAYLSDNRTVTTVSYLLFLKDLNDGKTEVTVHTEIEGTYQAHAGSTNILNCYSLGVLEKHFLEKMSQ